MSEPFPKPRHDLDGFDTPGQRMTTNREDPLAELARLVGRDDPFRHARQPASNVASFPQANAGRHPADEPHDHEDFQDFDPAPHQYDDAASLHEPLGHHGHEAGRDDLHFPPAETSVEAFEPALGYPSASGRGEAPTLNADLWAEGALPQSGPTGDLFHDASGQQPEAKRAPRHTLMVLAAVVVLTGGGLGATFLMRDGSGARMIGGAPPTILATDTPVKVQSPDMANGTNPDGNTALLEKTGSDKVDNAKVVSNDEQPVDLNQLPKSAAGQAGGAAPAGSSSPFPEPRKVKTVLIRPDGSVVGEAPQPVTGSASQQSVGMVLPMAAGGPVSAAEAPATEPRASTPKSTARASSTPSSPTGAASGAKGTATAAPHAAKPVAVASTASDAAPTPAAAPGTWAVQLGAPPSEQEAKDMAGRLQKKFAGELGGLKPGIVKAEKDGKALYRVRVGSLNQADASALCAKLKTAGGSCFAVKN